VAVDTLETAVEWGRLPALRLAIEAGIRRAFAAHGEAVHVSSHVSHVYGDGGSLYTTYLFRQASDPDATLERWSAAKQAASRAIVAAGATISHQHGVGLDHREHLAAEKGAAGMALLGALTRHADPEGRMNPGKLL
jgi:alkyldihydroxyacetonephosphate synthase